VRNRIPEVTFFVKLERRYSARNRIVCSK